MLDAQGEKLGKHLKLYKVDRGMPHLGLNLLNENHFT